MISGVLRFLVNIKSVMKRLKLFILILIFPPSLLFGQIMGANGKLNFEDTISLSPLHEWVSLPNPESNIWKTGKPFKTFFNSGHEDDTAISTGLFGPYPENCNSYFTITLPWPDYLWGEGNLSFYHKFDTDTLTDGGFIEISYDSGKTWTNVRDDINHITTSFNGLYTDTIRGGEYAFSGRSDEWQYVELYWFWLAITKKSGPFTDPVILKFRFISDAIQTDKEGWLIDDIVFRGYDLVGNIGNARDEKIKVYPNPSNGIVYLDGLNSPKQNISVSISGLDGRVLKKQQIRNNYFDISDMNPGIYIYRIYTGNQTVSRGTIVKYMNL